MPAYVARPSERARHALAPGRRVTIRPNYPSARPISGTIERICYHLQAVWLVGDKIPYSIPHSTIHVKG